MIQLSETHMKDFRRKSSKGNQLKWEVDGIWYKADFTGYEGLAEYITSKLMGYSDLKNGEYVLYDTEKIEYKKYTYLGCKSRNLLSEGEQLITLERLYKQRTGESLYKNLYHIIEPEERLLFLVEQVENITGITEFGRYMVKLFTLDAFFLNEDRHTHNIAVIEKMDGSYMLCPFFDHGASLLSDIKLDYPLDGDIYSMISEAESKTISENFDVQLDIAEKLYGDGLRFSFSKKEVEMLLEKEKYYPKEIKRRVKDIIFYQMRKYLYLFEKL